MTADAVAEAAGHAAARCSAPGGLALGAAVVTAFLLALLAMSGAAVGLPAVAALWLGVLIVFLAGELILSVAGAGLFPGRITLALVCGFVASAMVQLFGVFIAGVDAATAFLIWGGMIAICAGLAVRRLRPGDTGSGVVDAALLILPAGLVLFAFRGHVGVFELLRTEGVLLNTDGVIHAAQLAQFGDPLSFGRGSAMFADVPLGLYHYGYYMPAAAIMRLFALAPLATEAAILVPLGVFIGAAGALALASSMAGPVAGLLALGALFALPDGAHLGVGNRFFGFQTVVLFEPGSGYAIGGALAALACFERGRRLPGRGLWIASALLVAATFQLRAHVFILFAPTMALLFAGEIPFIRRRRPAVIGLAFVLLLAGILAVALLPGPHAAVSGFSNAPAFFAVALDTLGPTFREGLFASLVTSWGMGVALAVGLAVVVAAILGILLPAYLIAFALVRLRRGVTSLDAFPLLLLVLYALLILLAPRAPFDDATTEFQHRPLVLVFAVFATFTGILVARILRRDEGVAGRRTLAAIAAGVALLSIAPQALGLYTAEMAPAALSGFIRRATEPALLETGERIRAKSAPGMTLAVADIRAEDGNIDSCAELMSISGVPCYLSRPSSEARVSAVQAAIVAQRLSALDRIAASADLAEARQRMREAGIDWYLVRGSVGPRFDPQFEHAELRNPLGALYGRAAGDP